ncbi:hypothetical protein CAPTEDRAFT_205298 [Capitella teleta]|uniref:Sushi domain-containing protein n=1 Tax=Capitella teleta TaxID=283909 RepID=R7UNC5_CAPTE|nr:hypothetical protein CAPTEDRAFT_205298 [Capitella teleta]|eukprot:ELU07563.1 hypothetical protein CAPTEDRAFT_205298 [Capitella teleta]
MTDTYCDKLADIKEAELNTTSTVYGTAVEISCNPGYYLEGGSSSVVLVCQDDLQWSRNISHCLAVECRSPPSVVHSTQRGSSVTLFSNVTYECDGDYRHEDGYTSKTITCQTDGEWSQVSMSCGHSRCPPVPEVLNANPDTRLSLLQTTVNYTCYDGFIVPDESQHKTARCNGRIWNVESSDDGCNAIVCLDIIQVDGKIVDSLNVHPGAEVNISCHESAILSTKRSHMIVRCLENGKWNQGIPDCIEKSRSKPVIEPVEARGSDLIGIVAGLSIGLLCLFIIVIDASAIAGDCKKLQNNICGMHN